MYASGLKLIRPYRASLPCPHLYTAPVSLFVVRSHSLTVVSVDESPVAQLIVLIDDHA